MKLVEKFRFPWGSPPLTVEQAKRAREGNEARRQELRRELRSDGKAGAATW